MQHTVRIISLIIILVLLIIAAGLVVSAFLSSSSQKLESYIVKIETGIDLNDWVLVEQQLELLEKDWAETQLIWATLLDHIEIDNIDMTISKLKKYIETREIPLALAELAALRQYVSHIPKKEAFNIENIL